MKIGFTCSSFDLLHAGHIAMLEECKKNCDKLVVGLNVNPMKRGKYPVQGLFERWMQLQAVKWVDEIIPYNGEEELLEIFNTLSIDIRFIGSDYKNTEFTGKQINIKNGTEIFYNNREHNFSSSRLKQQVLNNQLSSVLDGKLIKSNETYDLIDNQELEKMTTSSTILKPGKKTRGHSHAGQEEVYVFMSGRGRMKIDDDIIEVKKDSVVPIKDGQFHQVFNDSDEEDMLFIAVFDQIRKH